MKALPFVALAAVTLLVGCATSPKATSLPASGDSTCTESSSRQIVRSFIDAFNNGNSTWLNQLLADYPQYATDAPGEFSSRAPVSRSDLIAYFMQRHQAHERLKLESLQINGRSANDFNFEFEVLRSADGLGATPYSGSGAVFCGNPSNTLIAWGMGREPLLRARLPLYGAAALPLLGVLAAAIVIVVRRARGKKKKAAARAVHPEWIDV